MLFLGFSAGAAHPRYREVRKSVQQAQSYSEQCQCIQQVLLHALKIFRFLKIHRYSPKYDPGGVVRVHILRFSEILPERWVPGGIIILTRETKIAEMNLSEPFKNDFQSSEKSVEKKMKMFAWKIVIFHDFRVFWEPGSHHL